MPSEVLAILLGGPTECAKQLRLMMTEDNREIQETVVLAYVRGAMRGEEGPLNEDGSHYGDW